MEKKKNTQKNILIALGALCIVFVFMLSSCMGSFLASAGSSIEDMDYAPENSFAIINISGTIQAAPDTPLDTTSYNHSRLMEYVDSLIDDQSNHGILLKVNSGGGTVYHSDEMYLKLMEYKEKTGRPVHAYFESTAASGAYYISCAAEHISANRNCWTGSIGVIISYVNMSGLMDKLGVEEIVISTGPSKGMGSSMSTLTEEQRRIYQGLVDESYEVFTNIVAESRNMDIEKVKQLADGRVYTARQALENGLVDEINSWEDAVSAMEFKTGQPGYEKVFYSDATWLDYLLYGAERLKPESDMAVIDKMTSSQLAGVPLYMYRPQ